MARYAVVEAGAVVNIVQWDGVSTWEPPAGTAAVADPNREAAIGGAWDGEQFTPPPPPEPAPDWSGLRAAVLEMPELGATDTERLSNANALFSRYPTANTSVDEGNHEVLRATVDLMFAESAIDQAKHDAFVQLMADHHIPGG